MGTVLDLRPAAPTTQSTPSDAHRGHHVDRDAVSDTRNTARTSHLAITRPSATKTLVRMLPTAHDIFEETEFPDATPSPEAWEITKFPLAEVGADAYDVVDTMITYIAETRNNRVRIDARSEALSEVIAGTQVVIPTERASPRVTIDDLGAEVPLLPAGTAQGARREKAARCWHVECPALVATTSRARWRS